MRILSTMMIAAGVVLVPVPAHANPIPGEVTSTYDSTVAKSATITCPGGEVVLGMGGWVSDEDGDVVLTGVSVDSGLTSVTASGHARPGFKGLWSVTARAVCGSPEYFDVERVVGTGIGGATASCPESKIVYSSGYQLLKPDGTQYVDRLEPALGLGSLAVHAGTTGTEPVAVVAHAICGANPGSFNRPYSTSPRNQASPKTATVESYGVWMLGAGGSLASARPAFINGFGPTATLNGAKVRAAIVKNYTASGQRVTASSSDDDWELTVYGTLIGSWY